LNIIENLKNVANKTVTIIKSNVEQINNLNSLASNNSANYEELTSSINSIFENTKQSATNSKKLKEVIDKGLEIIKETTLSIESISTYNEKIKSMVNIISGIAETTNLLAMNAAIEAAHAGEKGKGFAVVATEIRKLAEISSDNSKSISKELRDMSSKIIAAVSFSKKLNDEISSINYHVDDTIDRVFQIEQAMSEQSQNANSGLDSIMKLNDIIKILKDNSETQQSQEKDLLSFIHFIEDFNEKIKELLSFQKNMGLDLSDMFNKVSVQYEINEKEITSLWEKVKNIQTQNI
jgi:methyl-accepting chemotaxis protein